LWGFGKMLDFGLGTSIVKFVAEFQHKADLNIKNLISTCFFLMIVLGLVIIIAIWLLGELIYFGNQDLFPVKHVEMLWKVFLILGVSFYFSYISITIKSFFEGMQNFVTPSKINVVFVSITLIAVIAAYIFKLSLIVLAILFLINSFLNLLITLLLFKRTNPDLMISGRSVKLNLVKKVLSFSLALQGSTILSSLIDPLIKYLIGNFGSIGLISVYEVARRFVMAITGFFNTTFRTILPKASVLSSKGDYKNFLINECVNLSKLGIIYSGTVFGIGTLFIPIVIQQVFNYDDAILMYFILAIPESINNFGYSIYNFIIGIERALFLTFVQLINISVIGISVSVGLLIFGNTLGLFGYGLTIIIVNVMMLLFVKKVAGISIKNYLIYSKIHKLILLLLLLLAAIIILHYNYISFYPLIIAIGGLCTIIFSRDIKNYSKVMFSKIDFNRSV
jgi:O-antigen/teichoic acid export membrane protein